MNSQHTQFQSPLAMAMQEAGLKESEESRRQSTLLSNGHKRQLGTLEIVLTDVVVTQAKGFRKSVKRVRENGKVVNDHHVRIGVLHGSNAKKLAKIVEFIGDAKAQFMGHEANMVTLHSRDGDKPIIWDHSKDANGNPRNGDADSIKKGTTLKLVKFKLTKYVGRDKDYVSCYLKWVQLHQNPELHRDKWERSIAPQELVF